MNIYERAKTETGNLEFWVDSQKPEIERYFPDTLTDHPAVSLSQIISGVTDAIKCGDQCAIEMGIHLLLQNQKICFGVSLKTRIITSLKSQVDKIGQNQRYRLTQLLILLLTLKYPPREIKWYCRLVKSFGKEYRDLVVNTVNSNTKEASRWIQFLSC